MRIAHTKSDEPLDELATRVYALRKDATATERRAAGRTLRDANPFLGRLSDVPEGTLLVVPELEETAPADHTESLGATATALLAGRIGLVAEQAIELLADELGEVRDDARHSLEVLRDTETKRLTRADADAKLAHERTTEAVDERLAAADELNDYRKQVAAQVRGDLDELLSAFRGTDA